MLSQDVFLNTHKLQIVAACHPDKHVEKCFSEISCVMNAKKVLASARPDVILQTRRRVVAHKAKPLL